MAGSSEVIYLPTQRRETLGSDLGGLLGAVVVGKMQADENARQQAEIKQFYEGIRKAPDRATAFEVVANHSVKFKTPQDYSHALEVVDKIHPASLETPTPITAYDAMGDPTTAFPTRQQMVNPAYWKGQNLSLTKPDVADFYQAIAPDPEKPIDPLNPVDPQYQSIGRMPVQKRPAGALTIEELRLAQQGRSEKRADATAGRAVDAAGRAVDAAARADERADLSERRFAAAQERSERMMATMATRLGDTEGGKAQSVMKSAQNLLAMVNNGKQMPDGTWAFDVDKKDTYIKQLDYITAKIDANPSILKHPTIVQRLVSEATKNVGDSKAKVDDTPAPVKPRGFLDRLVRGEEAPAAKPAPAAKAKVEAKPGEKPGAMSAEDKAASVTNAKAAAARVRSGAGTTEEKAAKLAAIRKRLKDAGIQGDI